MPYHALVGPLSKCNLTNELRLGPDGASQAGVFRNFGEGAFVDHHAIQFFLQFNPHRIRVASACPPRVDQFALLIKAENQRTERNALLGQRVPRNHKLLALDALDLHPVATARRLIRRVGQLRDDPLESELASFLEKLRAIPFDVIAVAKYSSVAQRLQQLGQHALPLAQRRAREIKPIDIDQIEDIEDEAGGRALIDRLLQSLKTRTARRIQRDDLSIEYRALQRQRFHCLSYSRSLRRPILAVPRPKTNFMISQVV